MTQPLRATDPAPAARQVAARPDATLNSVGARFVRAPIPIKGYVSGLGARKHRLVLQRYSPAGRRWVARDTRYVRNGAYRMAVQRAQAPGTVRFRTVLHARGRRVDVSNAITVRIVRATCASSPGPTTCPQPAAVTQQRSTSSADCPRLLVTTAVERRRITWRWSTATLRWTAVASAWTPVAGSESERAAGVADCVKVVDQVPAGALLPDIRMKDLTKCGAGDSAATGGTCFLVVPSAPFNADFPALEGRKLLKFGVITMNVGAGPAEVLADRSAEAAADWTAYQSFYGQDGVLLGSVVDPGVQFYFAGDGHNHWHVRDFDDYELLDDSGSSVAVAEKHGYCLQDNTAYQPLQGAPGVPTQPVYADATSCGKGLPNALTIIHGLSRGWGDTYPTTLPDQAIDITGVPDGTYTVRVHADAAGAVIEADETNNVTEVKIEIAGDTVTVVPDTSVGGLG